MTLKERTERRKYYCRNNETSHKFSLDLVIIVVKLPFIHVKQMQLVPLVGAV